MDIPTIKGTFLDEISHDIPHQNWGEAEWDQDFASMKMVGIKQVILIRCGYKRWVTYPSKVLETRENTYRPPVDLVDMFLRLAEKYDMDFYFGLYDSGQYWINGDYKKETEINLRVIDEVWSHYGHYPAFKGWYVSQETSRNEGQIIETYRKQGMHCKAVSDQLPVMISPYIDGRKALISSDPQLARKEGVTPDQHEREWTEILSGLESAVDIVAFQDGQVEFDELDIYLQINKNIAEKFGMQSWSNTESFDRDMPIKFLPIKWEKLRLKIEAAQRAGVSNIITFEFSHFMSPNSAYPQAHNLYKRYKEYLESIQVSNPS